MLNFNQPNLQLKISPDQFEHGSLAYLTARGEHQKISELTPTAEDLERKYFTLLPEELCPIQAESGPQVALNALAIATFNNDYNTAKALLELGANVDTTCSVNLEALNLKQLKDLIPGPFTLEIITPIIIASIMGHSTLIELLLKYQASTNHIILDNESGIGFKMDTLYLATYFSQPEAIKSLSQAPNIIGNIENSGLVMLFGQEPSLVRHERTLHALMLASSIGDIPTLQALLDAGAQLNQKVNDVTVYQEALEYAIEYNQEESVKFLLKHRKQSNEDFTNRESHLCHAVRKGNATIVKELIKYIDDIDQENEFGMTPLKIAIEEQPIDIIELLTQAGANLKEKTFSKSPLVTALKRGSLDVLTLLLRYGADFKLKNHNGESLLHKAVRKGFQPNMIKFLHHHAQLDINARNKLHQTPLDLITRKDHKGSRVLIKEHNLEAVYTLIDLGAHIRDYPALLNIAAYSGHTKLLKTLLNKVERLSWHDRQKALQHSEEALQSAAEKNRIQAIILLIPNLEKSLSDVIEAIKDSNRALWQDLNQLLSLTNEVITHRAKIDYSLKPSELRDINSSLQRVLFCNLLNRKDAVLGCINTSSARQTFISKLIEELFEQPNSKPTSLLSNMYGMITSIFKSKSATLKELEKNWEKVASRIENNPVLIDSLIIRCNPFLLAGRGLASLPSEIVDRIISFATGYLDSPENNRLFHLGFNVQRENYYLNAARQNPANAVTDHGSRKRPRLDTHEALNEPKTKKLKRQSIEHDSLKRPRPDAHEVLDEPETKKLKR